MKTKKDQAPPQFLTEAEFQEQPSEQAETFIEVTDWDKTMQALSTPNTRLAIPSNREFNRKQVVTAFSNAFELIGGVPRLALWADANPSDFFKLYSRLLPSQSSSALGESNELVIKHVLPRGRLDE